MLHFAGEVLYKFFVSDDHRQLADHLKARLSQSVARSKAPAARRGISFSEGLVRAIIDGRKTETRRPAKGANLALEDCPHGVSGERVFIREKWADLGTEKTPRYLLAADDPHRQDVRWIAGRFMPSEAARRFLLVTEVRLEALHDIEEASARREGVPADFTIGSALDWFRGVWEGIYGQSANGWRMNPLVWVIRFRLDPPTPHR
jgi:hypothetical protein